MICSIIVVTILLFFNIFFNQQIVVRGGDGDQFMELGKDEWLDLLKGEKGTNMILLFFRL